MDIQIGHTYRHVKTDGVYVVLHLGVLEATNAPVVIYQRELSPSAADELRPIWVRPLGEFVDGRFEEIGKNELAAWERKLAAQTATALEKAIVELEAMNQDSASSVLARRGTALVLLRTAQREQVRTTDVATVAFDEASTAREQRDTANAELARIDTVLGNRTALKDKGSRADKIMHAIDIAKEVYPLRAEVERLQRARIGDSEIIGREKSTKEAALADFARVNGLLAAEREAVAPTKAELAALQHAYSELLCKTPSRPRPMHHDLPMVRTKLAALRSGAAAYSDDVPANRSTIVARLDEILALLNSDTPPEKEDQEAILNDLRREANRVHGLLCDRSWMAGVSTAIREAARAELASTHEAVDAQLRKMGRIL